jgi:hypothetical protein
MILCRIGSTQNSDNTSFTVHTRAATVATYGRAYDHNLGTWFEAVPHAACVVLARCEFLAYVASGEVDVPIETLPWTEKTFSALVVSQYSYLFIQLALVGDFQLLELLFLHRTWII